MPSSDRKAIAVAKADDLLSELHIRQPDEIDIERIALFKGAEVRYGPLQGMDGCLVRKGESAIITIRSSLKFEGQRRFVIAHELGHFFLHPRTRQIETVDKQQANNWSEKQETEEYEANLFAAELLMRRTLFAPRGADQEPSFELIEALAKEFSTTLTATAVQFVRTTQEECAVVSAADRHRKWFILSPGFEFEMLEDDYIHGHSCAAEVNATKLASRSSDIEAGFWLEDFRCDHKSLITEDARFFPSLNRSLSLLWIHDEI
jgi:Zn-dependent peptidase ImmA (M78 family)